MRVCRKVATFCLIATLVVALMVSGQEMRGDEPPVIVNETSQCPLGVNEKAKNTVCTLQTPGACTVKYTGNILFGFYSCAANIVTTTVFTNDFECGSAPPNALAPMFGSLCVEKFTKVNGVDVRATALCATTTMCIYSEVNAVPTCTAGPPVTTPEPLYTTVPCIVNPAQPLG